MPIEPGRAEDDDVASAHRDILPAVGNRHGARPVTDLGRPFSEGTPCLSPPPGATTPTGTASDSPARVQSPAEAPAPRPASCWAGCSPRWVLGALVFARSGQVPTILFVLGLALGFVLFHSRFGFTSAWRQPVAVRQGRALRAHMLMLAVACTLFAPILASGASFGDAPPAPSLAPIGFGLFVGSFLFGIGMQLGGSCASGTLFAIGSGQSAIVLTLAGFVIGSVLGAYTFDFWTTTLPSHPPVSLADTGAGYLGAWLMSLAAMAVVVALTYALARRRTVPPLEQPPVARGAARAVRGSWPLWVGALLLAGLNALTLCVSGSAWGITFAFALWGSKILDAIGVDVQSGRTGRTRPTSRSTTPACSARRPR